MKRQVFGAFCMHQMFLDELPSFAALMLFLWHNLNAGFSANLFHAHREK